MEVLGMALRAPPFSGALLGVLYERQIVGRKAGLWGLWVPKVLQSLSGLKSLWANGPAPCDRTSLLSSIFPTVCVLSHNPQKLIPRFTARNQVCHGSRIVNEALWGDRLGPTLMAWPHFLLIPQPSSICLHRGAFNPIFSHSQGTESHCCPQPHL